MNQEPTPGAPAEEALFEFSRPAWQSRANCHPDVIPHVWQEFGDSPVDLFYPEGLVTRERRAAIAAVCGDCPVRAECRAHAVQHERVGFWGGVGTVVIANERSDQGVRLHTLEIDRDHHQTIGTFIPPAHGSDARYYLHFRAGEKPCDVCTYAHAQATEELKSRQWQERKRSETPEQRARRLESSRVRGRLARERGRRLGV